MEIQAARGLDAHSKKAELGESLGTEDGVAIHRLVQKLNKDAKSTKLFTEEQEADSIFKAVFHVLADIQP